MLDSATFELGVFITGRRGGKASVVLIMFCFLIWVLITHLFSLWKFFELYAYDMCSFLYIYYTSKGDLKQCNYFCVLFQSLNVSSLWLKITQVVPKTSLTRAPALGFLPLLLHWYWVPAGARSAVWELSWPEWEGPGREG